MISNNKIKEILEQMSEKGFAIGVRDISYILLCRSYEDDIVAYKSLFGDSSETEITYYKQSTPIVELGKLMADSLGWNSKEDITFEENKAYMLKLKADTERAMADGEIDKKDGLKILTDISTKLNDKFGAKEEMKDQIVQIAQKFDDICPYCSHEVARRPISKEEAIKMYNLVEKQ